MEPDPGKQLNDDIELLRQVATGDRRSFEALYDRFSDIIFTTAYRVLHNQESAEDVLQDVFIKIWEKAPSYDPSRGRPLTWAITLTHNQAIDRLRSTQRRNRLNEDVQLESVRFEQFHEYNSFDEAASNENTRMVRKAVKNLPKIQREPIELAFCGSLTQTEIAERLNQPLVSHRKTNTPAG
ncbi:MAG: sigma-70 family RNA polymerase sigma factor, partial [Pseudomonadota bacterium]